MIIADPTKRIVGNIVWVDDESHSPAHVFRVSVRSDEGHALYVVGRWNPKVGKLSYALLYRGLGRIYALDMGVRHRNPTGEYVGETHKHSWTDKYRDKLAYTPRDITARWNRPVEVWKQFCAEARFMYPDGDVIDVFVEERNEGFIITDYGEALGWLRMQSFSERLTSNQRRMADDICLTLGVELKRGEMSLRYADASELGAAIHTLGQAAVRMSDIWFTLRTRAIGTIGDEVEEWLRDRSFDFERNRQHTGQSGRVWKVDYEVVVEAKTSLVFLLSTGTQAWARRMSERVVAGCTDLVHLTHRQPSPAFVSLFDDSVDVWREEDFALVQRFSRIASWSEPDEFEAILTTEWAAPSPLLVSP